MAQDKMSLDHNSIMTIKIAANALHLARSRFLIDLQDLPPEDRSQFSDKDRADYSDFRLFRERLEYWGIVDRLIAPPFSGIKPLSFLDGDTKSLFASGAGFAEITLREMPFSDDDWAKLNAVKSKPLDKFDMEHRLCELHPSPFLTELRAIVLGYLEGYYAAPVELPSQKEVVFPKPKNLGADHKFVAEGVRMVIANEALNANHAAELLLSAYGWACRGEKDSKGKIIAASENAAKTRLQKRISKELKSYDNT